MSRQTELSTECGSTPRRHSCAVGTMSQRNERGEGFRRSSLRRSSFTDNLDSLTRSMSATLSLVHRRSSFSNSLDFGDFQLKLDKNIVQAAICRQYQDQTITVRFKMKYLGINTVLLTDMM